MRDGIDDVGAFLSPLPICSREYREMNIGGEFRNEKHEND